MMVAAHQPHYLAWLGYIDKIHTVDIFCLVDTIPFEEQIFQYSNKIRSWNEAGEEWLAVPVIGEGRSGQLIKDVEISPGTNWREDHWQKIKSSYGKAPFFHAFEDFFEDLYKRDWKMLADLNEYMTRGILDFWGMSTQIVRSSALGVEGRKANIHVEICRKLGADQYMSGAGQCKYLDQQALRAAGIQHHVQQFTHPTYSQVHGDFMPNMAAIDLLFNYGKKGAEFFRKVVLN